MIHKNSTTSNLLKYVAVGSAVVVLSIVAPQLPYKLLRSYVKNKKFQRWRFLADLKRLQSRKLISYTPLPNGEIKIVLLKQGVSLARKLTLQYNIENMKIKKPDKWDGKWHLVIFDIPHRHRQARDILREKIKSLGFYQLQKSVFIHLYPCDKEIEFIATHYNVRQYVMILTVSDFEGEEKLAHSVFRM